MKSGKAFTLGCLSGIVLILLLLAGAALAAHLFLTETLAQYTAKSLVTPPLPSTAKANLDWTVESLSGESLDLKTLAGKTIFLHFWSPGCIVCLSELEGLNNLYGQVGDTVEFLCVARADFDELPAVVSAYNVTAPVYSARGSLPDPFDHVAAPSTFIIAPGGEIAFCHTGGAKWDASDVVTFLRGLATPPPAPAALPEAGTQP